jgi:2-oxoglutarate/2-oxoacid ferredoxin oxidoreductase subunit beta
VARSFSGDSKQLRAILKAALSHRGTCMIDVLSPCVTFNDHEGSTKSYAYVKEHDEPLGEVGFVPYFDDITVDYDPRHHDVGDAPQRVDAAPHEDRRGLQPDRPAAGGAAAARDRVARRVRHGRLYVEPDKQDFIELLGLVDEPLATLPDSRTRPGKAALDDIMESFR